MRLPHKAYVLGNGPTLPVDDLHKLSGAFTVGVNRILQSGFEPTMVFFADMELLTSERDAFAKTHALVVGSQEHNSTVVRSGVTWVHTVHHEWAPMPLPSKRTFYVHGSSAAAMALWLLAVGVRRVQMMGCSCDVVDGKSHFYGAHPDPLTEMRYQATADYPDRFRKHLAPLLSVYPARVFVDDNITDVDDIEDQGAMRVYINAVLAGLL